MAGDMPEFLAPRDVAAIFRVGSRSVTEWADAGLLEFTRTPGGHRRYPSAQFAAVVRAGPLLTVAEVVALLGVHENTVTRRADQGKVTMVRTPGGVRRYPAAQFRARRARKRKPRPAQRAEAAAA